MMLILNSELHRKIFGLKAYLRAYNHCAQTHCATVATASSESPVLDLHVDSLAISTLLFSTVYLLQSQLSLAWIARIETGW